MSGKGRAVTAYALGGMSACKARQRGNRYYSSNNDKLSLSTIEQDFLQSIVHTRKLFTVTILVCFQVEDKHDKRAIVAHKHIYTHTVSPRRKDSLLLFHLTILFFFNPEKTRNPPFSSCH